MAKRLALLSLAMAVLLAGCSGTIGGPPTASTLSASNPTSSIGPGGTVSPREASVPLEVAFDQCRAAGTNFDYPESIGPGQYPPAWEAPSPVNVDTVSLLMFECDRIGWGPFERGPIRLMLERHNKLNPPRNCTTLDGTDGIVALWILHSLMVDDPALADYLQATYDLPVAFGHITITENVQNGVGTQVWSWAEPGKPASEVTYYVANTTNGTGQPDTDRMYWYNATSLSYMNLRTVAVLDQVPPAVNHGTMRPPMLYTYNGMTDYVGTGQKYDSVETSANLKRYGDFQCQDPLPS